MGKIVKAGVNDLVTTHPKLLDEWHPEKNLPALPSSTLATTSKKIWWLCSAGHEWQAAGESRARGTGCPICAGQRVLEGFNDLATTHPALAMEWDRNKNHPLEPTTVIAGTHKEFWWLCDQGHSWKAKGSKRALGQGCPVCSGRLVIPGINDLASMNPVLASEWHPTKNKSIYASQITTGSGLQVWWICPEGHSWQTSPNQRKSGSGCPVCTGQKIEVGFNDLATTNPSLSSEFHPSRNGSISFHDVGAGTNKKLWWLCKNGHEWQAIGANRLKGSGCPICSGLKIIRGVNDLKTLHPKLAAEWHPSNNAPVMPDLTSPGSGTLFWWLCKNGHEWKARAYQRVRGAGCPVCSGRSVWAGYNDMKTTHPKLANEWHPKKNEGLKPDNFIAGANRKFWWICNLGHEWRASGNKRANGQGCPECAKSGFDPGKPAYFYFMQNLEVGARKVGITNKGTDRLTYFRNRGWEVLKLVETPEGHLVRELEAKILIWIRVKHEMPAALSPKDMGRRGGWTETFGLDGLSNKSISRKIALELTNLLKS